MVIIIDIETLKYFIPASATILAALFAFFYKHWTGKIEEYQHNLYTLQWVLEKNLLLLENHTALAEISFLPAFTLNKFPAIDDVVRDYIRMTNQTYASVKYSLAEIETQEALLLTKGTLEIIEIYLDLITSHLSKSSAYYYTWIFAVNRLVKSYSKEITNRRNAKH